MITHLTLWINQLVYSALWNHISGEKCFFFEKLKRKALVIMSMNQCKNCDRERDLNNNYVTSTNYNSYILNNNNSNSNSSTTNSNSNNNNSNSTNSNLVKTTSITAKVMWGSSGAIKELREKEQAEKKRSSSRRQWVGCEWWVCGEWESELWDGCGSIASRYFIPSTSSRSGLEHWMSSTLKHVKTSNPAFFRRHWVRGSGWTGLFTTFLFFLVLSSFFSIYIQFLIFKWNIVNFCVFFFK